MATLRLILALPLLGLGTPALGQTFPSDDKWAPFRCGAGPMVDGVHDQNAAINERDVVGNEAAPAAYRAVDPGFLYLRLRVEEAPTQGARLGPFAWGFAFSTGLFTEYGVLVTVDGAANQVVLQRNSAVTVANSATDPSDAPPIATYGFATHGRTLPAADSSFGGDRDHFIDMAVPWDALAPLGLGPSTPFLVWAASSSRADRLDGDFACHDAGGGSDVPDLRSSASASATASGAASASGAAAGPGGLSLEGGPGCSTLPGRAPPPGGGLSAGLLVSLLALRRRRARLSPHGARSRLSPRPITRASARGAAGAVAAGVAGRWWRFGRPR